MLKTISRWVFGVLLAGAGINHFANSDFYENIMPPYLPWPSALVAVSGAAEVLLGSALLVPRLARPAAFGIIALLIAVFPANIHMAAHPELYPEIPPAILWLRLPLQLVLVLWAYLYTRPAPVK
jgi:uncharacterized membrane protein